MIVGYDRIEGWVQPHAKVLDLGCGEGLLLSELSARKHVDGLGLELDPQKIVKCLERGLCVVQQDLNSGLKNFSDDQFDVVIMTQNLQAIRRPDIMLQEMLRVGREAVVTFPNFAHWQNRIQLGIFGHMPVSSLLPNPWYNTPNIHLATFRDFESLCRELGIRMIDRDTMSFLGQPSWLGSLWPNLFGEVAVYRIGRGQ